MLRINRILGLAALFTPGFVTAASADVVSLYNLNLALNGNSTITNPVFSDSFNGNQVLAGGTGAVLPAGPTYSDGIAAFYLVIGTVQETGSSPTVLNTAQGGQFIQTTPGFFPVVNINALTLLTGPSGSHALTQTGAFATSALFSVSSLPQGGGFYQVNLSNRVQSNNFLGDVISVGVTNCSATSCGGVAPGPHILLTDANAAAGTVPQVLGSAPLNTSEQQILLELTKPDPSSDTVDGFYQYATNGIPIGSPILLGTYSGLFGTGLGQLDYTQTGIVQLAPAPEPSSLALLASSIAGVAGFVRCKRRKAPGPGSSSNL
jgi:hypothetical protein